MQVLSVFVSELLMRGLNRGILLRAGLAAGIAEHTEEQPHKGGDVRTRNITIIGDGFTLAVLAERRKDTGVHAWLCPRLLELLGKEERAVGEWRTPFAELFWWTNFRALWPTCSAIEHCSPISALWCDDTIERLQGSAEFEWNRSDPRGMAHVEDTIQLLRSVRVSVSG